MKTDPAIERTREVRRSISASVGDDPAQMVEYYIRMQKRFEARLRYGQNADQEAEGEGARDSVANAPKDT